MELADRDRRLGRLRLGGLDAAQDRAHAGDHLGAAERLDDVVVGAELEADDAVGLGAAGGEDDDRDAATGADRAAPSRPSPSGRWRSSRIRSGSSDSCSARARAAVAATCGSEPSRSSAFENGAEIDCSSSTNRMRGRSFHPGNIEVYARAFPRFYPALAGAWRAVADRVGHEAITPSDRSRSDRGRPRHARHRRPRARAARDHPSRSPHPSRPPPPLR